MRVDGTPSIAGGIGESDFYTPPDAFVERFGVEALADVLGDEEQAARLSWTRRLVRRKSSDEWLLTITECPFISSGDVGHDLPWLVANATSEIKIAYPLKQAVEILASPENPELELARRRRLIEEQQSRERGRALAAQEKAADEAKTRAQHEKNAREFREADWQSLTPLERFAYSLAVAVQPHSPELAAAIRAVTTESTRGGLAAHGERQLPLPLPHCKWWSNE